MSDYHVHLHPHAPAPGEPPVPGPPPGEFPLDLMERYVETARSRGAEEIAFTEHLYRCVEAAPVLGRWWEREPREDLAAITERFVTDDRTLSLERYVDAVVTAKDRGLPVLLGLEVDFFPDTIDAVMELLDPYPWDILIGSVHWIGGWAIDSHRAVHEFERRGVEKAWEDYFALETELAASGHVDVLAHVDVCKKYGYRPATEPTHLYRRVVTAAASSGTAVEVSTQGLRRPVGELYPSATFLRMFAEAGVPITLASDAHVADEVAADRAVARAAARAAGYRDRLRFRGRRPELVPL